MLTSSASSRSLIAVILAATILLIVQDFESNAATVTARKPKNELGQNCTNHLQIIDRCSSLATYSFTTGFNQYPNNSLEMKESCDRIGDGLKCLKVYGKCLSNIARRSLIAFTGARSKHSKKLCLSMDDPKTVDFIKASECVVQSNKKTSMVASERELISALQMLTTNKTMKWDQRFHNACCAASNYKVKAIKTLEPECVKYKDTQEDMLNSMIGDILETACPDQNRLNEICGKLAKLNLPKQWNAVSLTGAALDLIVALADKAAI